MTLLRWIASGYFGALLLAAALNYVPGLTDENGLAFGVFALDIFDDTLHAASALWALVAGLLSHRASKVFLTYFGVIYLADGLMGLVTGSGYLDFGIFTNGVLDLPFTFKILTNLPHLGLGGFAVFAAFLLDRSK